MITRGFLSNTIVVRGFTYEQAVEILGKIYKPNLVDITAEFGIVEITDEFIIIYTEEFNLLDTTDKYELVDITDEYTLEVIRK